MSAARRTSFAAASLAMGTALVLGCECTPPPGPTDGGSGRDSRVPDAWELVPVHDPLSMPEEATLTPSDFQRSERCTMCHADHVSEWQSSMHAYAMVDPVFQALVSVRQADFMGTQDQFCVQCHSAIGTRGGEITAGFSFTGLSPITLEGVTCVSCHQVTELARDHNSGHVLDATASMRGPITDPVASGRHESASSELFGTSEFCAGCHDIVEVSGLSLERPYEEWLSSPARAAGRNCQSCHMPEITREVAPSAPERTSHEHRFRGVDLPLLDGFATPEQMDVLRADRAALLTSSADVRLQVPDSVRAGGTLDLVIDVESLLDAHSLPTGSTFIRQLWLEVVVRDAHDRVVYETGTLDGNGDLRDHWSALDPYGDPDLVSFSSSLTNAAGQPELFPWRSTEHFRRTLEPLHTRTVTLFVPVPSSMDGPLSVRARLRFRSHPPFLLRALGLTELVPRVEIQDIDEASASVEVVP
ncbi:MAG: hypothetical protein K1X94_15040 [Sandaracinaceae bacterium]|nr:hypothetical protein [Sandaracinaceae bacterium]